jgi:hypothetical protein
LTCSHKDIAEIDRRARIEKDIAKIAKAFSLSYPALYRHISAGHHIREATSVPTTSELATSEEIYREIVEWHNEAKALQRLAKDKGDLKVALLGLDKALRCLELMSKIHGLIREQNINLNLQQIVIAQSPEWIALRTRLLNVLDDYPQAREACMRAFCECE